MEETLDLYQRAYDPLVPLICFDERPCQLIGDVIAPLPMTEGNPQREDYHYKRNGVANLFIAFEPHTGRRFVQIRDRRTMKDYAEFFLALSARYPLTEKIRVIQDNLNTHSPASFYQRFSASEAWELSEKFEMHYTPTKASWLNMVEIELSVLGKQCLDRRIGDKETLSREVLAWVSKRNQQKATVNWQFTVPNARQKFHRFYPNPS